MGKIITCPNCKGLGKTDVIEKCVTCRGTGKIDAVDDWGKKVKLKCFTCRGSGKVTDKDTCNMCGGDGEIEV